MTQHTNPGKVGSDSQACPDIYRSLFHAYPDALLVVDSHGLITLANPRAAQLLGYDEAELMGLAVDSLLPESVRSQHAAYRQSYLSKPQPRPMGTQVETVARCRDGSEVLVEIALSPLQDHGLAYVVAAVRGIDSYPRVQQALRRARHSECLAQMARMAVDEPVVQAMQQRLLTAAATVLQADSAALLLLAPGQNEFTVASGYQLEPAHTLGMRIDNTSAAIAQFSAQTGLPLHSTNFSPRVASTTPAASSTFDVSALPTGFSMALVDQGHIIGVLTMRFAQQHQLAADEKQFVESLASLLAARLQRAHSEAALEHVQRLETVGQLTGGIAHDFNNLLTILEGNLQVLQGRPAIQADATAMQCLAAARRASARSAELTSKLLAFSRRQTLSPRQLDLSALLHELAAMLRRTLDRNIQVQLSAPTLSCMADPVQLESALLNLAVNARDAMPAGGVLRLACQPLLRISSDLMTELAPALTQGMRYVLITVSDTGTGMSADVRARAFEPFYTTKAMRRGTGLGLSSVYGFVKQSQGTVRISSELGKGTTVSLVLPTGALDDRGHMKADQAPKPKSVNSRSMAAVTRPIAGITLNAVHVLLVEDQAEVRRAVSQTLQALGCQVTEAATAEEALALLKRLQAPDLLLSDVALGTGMQGPELMQQARADWPEMAGLLMSAYAHDLVQPGPPQGASAATPQPEVELLYKPFDRDTLAAALRRALAATAASAKPVPPAVG